MKNITPHLFVIGLGTVALASILSLDSCRQNPLGPDTLYIHDTIRIDTCHDNAVGNLLVNGGFDLASTSIHDLGYNEMLGWNPYKGSPQAAAGLGPDGKHGFLQMWGNGDSTTGEGVTQHLLAPLVAGARYQVACDLAWMNDNPANYTAYVRVRFIAYNSIGEQETVGVVQTSSTSWTHLTAPVWTAHSRYTDLAVVVEDDNIGTNSATWAHLDNVSLTQVH